jgi:iron complex outermembrane recepter protein
MFQSINPVSCAVRRALILSAVAAAAGPVMAEDQPAASEEAAPVQEIIITGSRIKSPNVTAISPITTVSASDITATGLTRTEDILNNLPMVFAGQNSTVANGANGTASVDLRGLGAQRTLVLVNGRRLGPGPGTGSNISDINEVPAALIERVDILTGGASSVYGADAVAGVVNFVLNTRFQGVRIDAGYDFYQHHQHNAVAGAVSAAGDALPDKNVDTGFGKNVAVLIGSNFADDRGNATFFATYDQKAPATEAQYDYSACTLDGKKGGGLVCGGSGTSAKNGAGGYFQAYATKNNGGKQLFTNTVDGLTGQFRPFTSGDLYNFGPINFYQTPNTRWTAGGFLTFEVNPHVTTYGEVMYARNETTAQIAASGDFLQTAFIPCNDPLLTAQEQGVICSPKNLAAQTPAGGPTPTGINMRIGRRSVEGPGRVASFRSDTDRLVLGVRGDINDAWKYDAYAQRNTVDFSNSNNNYFSNANIFKALDVIPNPAPNAAGNVAGVAAGAPVCASASNGTDPTCVPWNIWQPNGVTAAAIKYLSIPLLVEATTTEQVVSGSMTGDLGKYGVKLPTADTGFQLNIGGEWRGESANFIPDYQSLLGNAAGAGGPTAPVAGSFTVREVFTEMSLPLADHQPFADSADVTAGYRYSSYSEGFNTNTYKVGLEWAPVQDIRSRFSYQRAVRAPNIFELYQADAVGLDGSKDPCASPPGTPPAASQAQCALTGVTGQEYGNIGSNPASQYNGFLGGNPKLKPETSDTYSAGFVLQPHWVPSLVVSIDYFNIKIKNTIGPIGGDTILQSCIATGLPVYCSAIQRDPNGSLWKSTSGFINDVRVNFGSVSTSGIDIKGDYRLPLQSFGSLTFSLEGTKLINLNTQPLTNGPSYNCEGLFGVVCGAPNPGWRHVLNTTWSTPWDALDIVVRWRYLGSAESELLTSYPALTGKALPDTAHIPAYNYIDLSAMFNLYKGIRLQLGVNNIADKDPPIISSSGGGYTSECPTITPNQSSCNGNTFPGTYDALGRFVFAHVTAQF